MVQVVVGILKKGDTFLIAERPQTKSYAGYWEFPGGKVEPGESHERALIRELHEELSIHVTNASPWFQHTHTYAGKTFHLDIWCVTQFSGVPAGQENQAIRWVTVSEIRQLNMLEGNWPIIDRIALKTSSG